MIEPVSKTGYEIPLVVPVQNIPSLDCGTSDSGLKDKKQYKPSNQSGDKHSDRRGSHGTKDKGGSLVDCFA